MSTAKDGLPILAFASPAAWEAWLEEHHASAGGLWLRIAKKGSGDESVSYREALDVALCFGWIDGQKAADDESHWLQRFTPRGPRSRWSKANRTRAAELEREGRMQPAGLAAIEAARGDGRWGAAYDSQRTAEVPSDLEQALAEKPEARAFFEALDGTNRYAILYRLQDAKKPETRARRLEKFVAMLEQRQKLHP